MKIWQKMLAAIAVFLGVIVATLSPLGTPVILGILSNQVAELEIEHQQGSFAGELVLNRLAWRDKVYQFELNDVRINLGWSCLLKGQLCLENIFLQSIAGKIEENNAPQPEQNEPARPISLPIRLTIEQAIINQIAIALPDQTKIEVSDLSSALTMKDALTVSMFRLKHVELTAPVTTPADDKKQGKPIDWRAISDWQYHPPSQMDFFIPISLEASKIIVEQFVVIQTNASRFEITDISADVATSHQEVEIRQLSLSHAENTLNLTAQIESDLAHRIDAKLVSGDENLPFSALNIQASGKNGSTKIQVETSGVTEVDAEFNADFASSMLPINADINWRQLELETDKTNLRFPQGSLSLDGNLQQLNLFAETVLESHNLPKVSVDLRGTGNTKQFDLNHMTVSLLDGSIATEGKLLISDSLSWSGESVVTNLQPHQLWQQLQANISGNITHVVEADGSNISITSPDINLQGDWLGFPLTSKGSLQYSSLSGLSLPAFNIASGNNEAEVQLSLSPLNELLASASIQASDFSQLLPGLSGRSLADIEAKGPLSAPDIKLSMSAKDIVFNQVEVSHANLAGTLDWQEQEFIEAKLRVSNIRFGEQRLNQASLEVEGPLNAHSASIDLSSGDMAFALILDGDLSDSGWQGKLINGESTSQIGHFEITDAPVPISVDWIEKNYQVGEHCWQAQAQQICLLDALLGQQHGDLKLHAKNLQAIEPLAKLVFPNNNVVTSALLDIAIEAKWQAEQLPTAKATASVSSANWQFDEGMSPLKIEKVDFSSTLLNDNLVSHVELMGPEIGQANANVELHGLSQKQTIHSALSIHDFTLDPFAPLLTDITVLEGHLNTQLTVTGALENPVLNGDMQIRNGALASPLLPSKISDLQQHITFKGRKTAFSGPFKLGQGQGDISGEIDWQQGIKGQLEVVGNEMEVDYKNLFRAKLSPDLKIAFSPQGAEVTGEMSIPYARVKVRDLPPDAISPSDDVVFVGENPTSKEVPWAMHLDVKVSIDNENTNQVKLDAFGLTSDLQGNFRLSNNTEVLIGDGELQLVNGRYKAYGQDLIIRKGEILFSGPLDSPSFDIEAVRDPLKTDDDVIAGIRVSGLADQPEISVFSEPDLEQSETLSYLLRGQSIQASSDTSSDTMLANVLIGFGLSKSENKITRAGNKLGIDDLALSTTGQGDETKLAISGYIAPGVQLRYGVGVFDSASEVALRYQLFPKLYLEAVSGLNNALDMYYQFSIDKKPQLASQSAPEN